MSGDKAMSKRFYEGDKDTLMVASGGELYPFTIGYQRDRMERRGAASYHELFATTDMTIFVPGTWEEYADENFVEVEADAQDQTSQA